MQFGIKVPGIPFYFVLIGSLETDLWARKLTRQIKLFRQHMKLHHHSYTCISMSFLQHILWDKTNQNVWGFSGRHYFHLPKVFNAFGGFTNFCVSVIKVTYVGNLAYVVDRLLIGP